MKKDIVKINNVEMNVYSLNTVIVGSGAAGFNAADSLYSLGQKDIAIVTEGVNMGTSRNTGSDKQTYYKLTLAGDTGDSIAEMAKTLFNGGSMHGDIALVEAALSARCFYKLVDIGVPFPHNRYGEYVGYKTDHDPGQRATSAGPLTSRYMTEKLERQVKSKDIKIFDRHLVIGILTDKDSEAGCKKSVGLIALNLDELEKPNMGFTLFNSTNVIYATGGPAGMYLTSVYPESQTGATGIALEAGVRGINLTESQYGLASVKFRWNLSGTYQQVIPRYVSTHPDGSGEREFLEEYFGQPGKMLEAIFLKGYQWPFDPRKIKNSGSSLIDILVYYETQVKGRRVYLDFSRNPSCGSRKGQMDFSLLGSEAYRYLENSGALFGTPVERLAKMNRPAIDLYRNHGIDLYKEYLEIAVCAQHNNGGLAGNIWWESNIRHFFPVGEANGTFGVYRPGGTALNSTQVGSLRAAQYITANYIQNPLDADRFAHISAAQILKKFRLVEMFMMNRAACSNITEIRKKAQERMSRYGAHIRSQEGCSRALEETEKQLSNLTRETRISTVYELSDAFRVRDILIAQFVYLSAIKEYIEAGGGSRGSYLVNSKEGELPAASLPDEFRFKLDTGRLDEKLCEIELILEDEDVKCLSTWKAVRPIPDEDNWFERVWNEYRNKQICIDLSET